MLSSDKNIETIGQLLVEIKHYIDLQGKNMQLGLVQKTSKLASALVLVGLVCGLFAVVLIFLSFTLASMLAAFVGQTAGYLLVALVYLLLAALIYVKRKGWIETPITRFVASILLSDDGAAPQEEDEQSQY